MWDRLIDELDKVRRRWLALRRASVLASLCVVIALLAIGLRLSGLGGWLGSTSLPNLGTWPVAVLLGLAVVWFVVSILALLLARSPRFDQIVRELERRFPDLDSRLHALWSSEQRAGDVSNYFRRELLQETLIHARSKWSQWKSAQSVWYAQLGVLGLEIVAGMAVALLLLPMAKEISLLPELETTPARYPATDWIVSPGDTEIEQGSTLRVTVRLPGPTFEPLFLVVSQSSQAALETQPTDEQRFELEPNLSDPIFTTSIPNVSESFEYRIESPSDQTRAFKVTTFQRPELLDFEVLVTPPAYTGLPTESIVNPRHLQAVSGTTLELRSRFRGVGVHGQIAGSREKLPLQGEALGDDTLLTASWLVTEDDLLVWSVLSAEGREAVSVPSLRIKAIPNNRPAVKWVNPRGDLSAHPLQEFEMTASAEDDFGVLRRGFTIHAGTADLEERVIESEDGETLPLQISWSDWLLLEERDLKPGRLLGLSAWAEDYDEAGQVRRTQSDLIFIDIRPFEWRFREADPDQAGQQGEQGSQAGQGGEQGQSAQLAEQQKQALIATWNLQRRDPKQTQWSTDIQVVLDAQIQIGEQLRTQLSGEGAAALDEATRLSVERATIDAVDRLMEASDNKDLDPLLLATQAQQTLLEFLISSAEEEMTVAQSQSQSSQPSSSQRAAGPSQQQLQSLELAANRNRYAQESQAQQQQEEQSREDRERLERLQDLARRQEDLNNEIQEAMEQREATSEEELQEQLERLRERQAELREDTEELQSELDRQAQEQQQRDQLSNARDAAQRTDEALAEGDLNEALAQGRRAEIELDDLRQQLQQRTGNQLQQAIDQLNEELGELEQIQDEIRSEVAPDSANTSEDNSLRSSQQSTGSVAEQLQERDARWRESLDQLRTLTEETESSSPRVSERLYDAYREAVQDPLEEASSETRRLMQQGNVDELQENEASVDEQIAELRTALEEASQLAGSEGTQALELAESMLDDLANEAEGQEANGNEATNSEDGNNTPSNQDSGAPSDSNESTDASQSQQDSPSSTSNSPGNGTPQESNQAENENSEQGSQGSSSNPQSPNNAQSQGESPSEQGESQSPSGQSPGNQSPGNQGSQQPMPGGQGEGEGGGDPSNSQPPSLRGSGQNGSPNQTPNSSTSEPREPQAGEPNANNNQAGGSTSGGANQRGPTMSGESAIVGEDFRDWLERLEDVESLVPAGPLRDEATRIRQRATEMRRDFLRHSLPPQVEEIEISLADPLRRLSEEVEAERRRQEGSDLSVRLDQDPIPPGWENQVRRYFERLGVGRE